MKMSAIQDVVQTGTRTPGILNNWQKTKPIGQDKVSFLVHGIISLITMDIHNINQVPAFLTKDGSEIRELLAHRNSSINNQSLAEARIAPGLATQPHYHPMTEEIYYILEGVGEITIGDEMRTVGPGDAIAIPPGSIHTIRNQGDQTLLFLCCCAPGYEHQDTVLMDPDGNEMNF